MHDIEPFYNWDKYYESSSDQQSPFYGKEYNYDLYSENIYGYYIDPAWDFIGSETLYIKILYADYEDGFVIIEMIGEWNDTINNDIMTFKRNIIDHLLKQGISKYILIGENIFNFHGSDDCYYEEWASEVTDDFDEPGWIVAMNFPDFVSNELANYSIHHYLFIGNDYNVVNWRTMHPVHLKNKIDSSINRKLLF
ncbi:MAG: hypothetical protein ACNS60_06635 [Candidatus Cyclobacteriaceae bacterium M2_1C_046]